MSTTEAVLSAEVIRAALAQMKPRPSVEMYPGDWLRDPISACSLAANGFWWRATMVMHDAKPYGHMVGNNGLPLTEQQIAQRCGCRTAGELRKVLAEIDSVGIPGRTGDADYVKILHQEPLELREAKWTLDLSPLAIEQAGVLYSRRMLRDRILSLVRFLVSPKGQSLVPSLKDGLTGGLTTGLTHQNLNFDRDARARSAEDEEEVGSVPTETLEGPKGKTEVPPSSKSLLPAIHKLQNAAFQYAPADNVAYSIVREYGAELVEETLIDCEDQYRGKHYHYFETILTGRRNNPDERPGNRRRRTPERRTTPPASSGLGTRQPHRVTLADLTADE